MKAIRNLAVTVCIGFTLLTLLSATWNLLGGSQQDTYYHQLMRFLICVVGFASIHLYLVLVKSVKPVFALLSHYLITTAFVLGLVWFSGLFLELHPQAYRDFFLNFSAVYVVVAAIELARQAYLNKRGGLLQKPSVSR